MRGRKELRSWGRTRRAVAGVVLALLSFAGAPVQAKGRGRPHLAATKRFVWPLPDLVSAKDLPGAPWSRGVPVSLKAVLLRHSVGELMPVYRRALQDAGFFLPPPKETAAGAALALTALDPLHQVSYTALFRQNRDGTTMVILGEASVDPAAEANLEPEEVPLFPGGQHALRSITELGYVLSYEVSAGPAEVLSFYRTALKKVGYAEPDPAGAPGLFVHGDDELKLVTLQASGGRGYHVVTTLRSRSRSAGR